MQIRYKKTWPERLARSRYFFGAVLLHLVLLLMFATWIIWKAPAPPEDAEFHPTTVVKVPPPPPEPPASGAAANNPQFEPHPVVVPPPTLPRIITTQHADGAFSINAPALDNTIDTINEAAPEGSGLSEGAGDEAMGPGNAFGFLNGSNDLLAGYFYDFTQTSDKQPNVPLSTQDFKTLVTKYIQEGWNDSLFESYYRSKAPLYTGTFAISTRRTSAAAAAFGLQHEVKSSTWIVHYHGRVVAPEEGNYRFAGFGDDIMSVKIKGETVLDAGWTPLSDKQDLHQTLPYALPSYSKLSQRHKAYNAHLRIGRTFHVDAAETLDMDVLVGDSGKACCFFLLVENEKKTYAKTPDGTPLLPFFQLTNKPAPTFSRRSEHPPYSTVPEPWQPAP